MSVEKNHGASATNEAKHESSEAGISGAYSISLAGVQYETAASSPLVAALENGERGWRGWRYWAAGVACHHHVGNYISCLKIKPH